MFRLARMQARAVAAGVGASVVALGVVVAPSAHAGGGAPSSCTYVGTSGTDYVIIGEDYGIESDVDVTYLDPAESHTVCTLGGDDEVGVFTDSAGPHPTLTIFLGDGNDFLLGGDAYEPPEGADPEPGGTWVLGEDGDDIVLTAFPLAIPFAASPERVTFLGGSGRDILDAGYSTGDDIFVAGSGNDIAFPGDGEDTVYGQDGNDCIFAVTDLLVDKLYGGAGWDRGNWEAIDTVTSVSPINFCRDFLPTIEIVQAKKLPQAATLQKGTFEIAP